MNDEQKKEDLINRILPWWKSRGWNPETLRKKNLYNLIAINQRMLNEAVMPKMPEQEEKKYRQTYLFDPMNDDGYGFEED